ncbi:class I SAM-dependent methyltransferase [Nostoc sp. DedQUE07]|uniref:class I SAM-dependent methyltransferase n=1 Tax=Nostoc sp. DedQUE07 TaxID=3075392 RepID=UPI002AD3495B|nr:class I SAM-dependent methyltransferase [Nostoc sp. DedQUE07]MDZ8131907.1 class I SAM-dependent methyltransferase [Nostoc sp. DedQUE07]
MQGQKNYVCAIEQGHYELQEAPSLYDYVRIRWENELTKMFLGKHLSGLLVEIGRKRKMRILDLGCGPGQGFKLLSEIMQHQNLSPVGHTVEYVGLDINQSMIQKAEETFGSNKNVTFVRQDLREGLGNINTEKSFDVYYSSYGSLSHLTSEELHKLLQNIVEHTTDYSLVVLDLLGRYSLEWPGFWGQEPAVYDYTMSWLYPKNTRLNIEKFPMTFWTGHSLKSLSSITSGINILDVMDRSILVGRHIDTGEYRTGLKPTRSFVNSLFNPLLRTNLEDLIIDKSIITDSNEPLIHEFFNTIIEEWNTLIEFCQAKIAKEKIEVKNNLSSSLLKNLTALDNIIEMTESENWKNCHLSADPRASFIEPELAYALRNLEYDTQLGIGAGHGLLAILEIKKLS